MTNAPAHLESTTFKMSYKMDNMKDKFSMAKDMEKESTTSHKEASIKDNGIMIKCMDMGNYTIQVENWHMKEDGNNINFQEKEKSTTMNHITLNNLLISLISIN